MEASANVSLCDECLGRLRIFGDATCTRCGAPVPESAARERCPRCRGSRFWFDEAVALGEYDGLLRDWMLRIKDARSDSLALAIAELIWHRRAARLAAIRPDVVIPVPLHWRRQLVRGGNSPAIIAERLAQHWQVPLVTGLLKRTRNTPPQFSLPPSERGANVRRAFAVAFGYHLEQAHVLLIDDILTTGSTCSAAARALQQAGATRVTVLVAARTLRH
jgi:ComF family protein